jgi:hypothetical protein
MIVCGFGQPKPLRGSSSLTADQLIIPIPPTNSTAEEAVVEPLSIGQLCRDPQVVLPIVADQALRWTATPHQHRNARYT